jgi:D-alanyl-D-alanine dipeptidase
MKSIFPAVIALVLVSFAAGRTREGASVRMHGAVVIGHSGHSTGMVELSVMDSTIHLDIRYATIHNFMGRAMYDTGRAFLRRAAAEALERVQKHLVSRGLGLMIFDAYRPWRVTKAFWDATPPEKRKFVANPSKGSVHNRGCAVDLTLYDRKTGKELPMPSGYDEFSGRAAPSYPGGTSKERANRALLRSVMEREGFEVNSGEWWHYDYRGWKTFDVLDIPFNEL